jgi:hypothetical protein
MTATTCHICSRDTGDSSHWDDAPSRFYCSDCAQCDLCELKDRCDSCLNVHAIMGDQDSFDARAAAAAYHGGMFSALYALSSTGTLLSPLRHEAAEALELAEAQEEFEHAQALQLLLNALDLHEVEG